MTSLLECAQPAATKPALRRPRLGFLGAGWIGRHRMEAVAKSGLAEIVAIAEPSREMLRQTATVAPNAAQLSTLEELSEFDLDGLAIATPNALHAAQSTWALERGIAVFCQKPLARTRAENQQVIDAARRANKLLGVDLSYRFLDSAQKIRERIQRGELGKIFAAEMVFHNAYGPDKAWFYNPELSGGGCVIDLGIHLVDLGLWWLGFPTVQDVHGRLFLNGRAPRANEVEDFGAAQIGLSNGAVLNVECSWKLHAGCDAIISGTIYGSEGGASFRNVNGSFYDFIGEVYRGRSREVISTPPDAWGERAILHWTERLARDASFDSEIENLIQVADTLDWIYGRRRA
jgi:predicted dehydrogenase